MGGPFDLPPSLDVRGLSHLSAINKLTLLEGFAKFVNNGD